MKDEIESDEIHISLSIGTCQDQRHDTDLKDEIDLDEIHISLSIGTCQDHRHEMSSRSDKMRLN